MIKVMHFTRPPKEMTEKEARRLFYSTLRVALTGEPDGLDPATVMGILGREETLRRIEDMLSGKSWHPAWGGKKV